MEQLPVHHELYWALFSFTWKCWQDGIFIEVLTQVVPKVTHVPSLCVDAMVTQVYFSRLVSFMTCSTFRCPLYHTLDCTLRIQHTLTQLWCQRHQNRIGLLCEFWDALGHHLRRWWIRRITEPDRVNDHTQLCTMIYIRLNNAFIVHQSCGPEIAMAKWGPPEAADFAEGFIVRSLSFTLERLKRSAKEFCFYCEVAWIWEQVPNVPYHLNYH